MVVDNDVDVTEVAEGCTDNVIRDVLALSTRLAGCLFVLLKPKAIQKLNLFNCQFKSLYSASIKIYVIQKNRFKRPEKTLYGPVEKKTLYMFCILQVYIIITANNRSIC